MTDRELLKLAAKAAGIEIDYSKFNGGGLLNDGFDMSGNAMLNWHDGVKRNPLNDDGDALRLAVKLRMDIEQSVPQDQSLWVCASVAESGIEGSTEAFSEESHRASATRRAIVRAAAEIGKTML